MFYCQLSPKGRKQSLIASALAVMVVLSISLISVRAVSIGNEKQAAVINQINDSTPIKSGSSDGIWLTGDSVILGIKSVLAQQHAVGLVNARVGRQAPELLQVIIHDKPTASTGPVVLNLGNNNALTEDEVVAILDELKDRSRVILVNTAVPRPWREKNNELIAQISARYPNVKVIDWASISEGHPEYFAPDGVHLVPTGVAIYVAEISKYPALS